MNRLTAHWPRELARRTTIRDTVVYTGVPQQAEPEFDPWGCAEPPRLAASRGLLTGICWGLVVQAVIVGGLVGLLWVFD